jgi:cyclophilin family peptidyl-prolyl cis-trans isomerase/predicted small secreted protein
MKKSLFFFAMILLALSLSACTKTNNTAGNDIVGTEINTQNEAAPTSLNNNLENNNAAPILNETSASSLAGTVVTEPVKSEAVTSNPMRTLENQEDLAKDYSQAVIKTNLGDITVKFYSADSPITVNNFLNLAKNGFYNGTKFHRIIKDFMIQGGDPLSKETDTSAWGTGGPDYRFADEFNSHKLVEGSLAMANAGPGTNGSQFFIVTISETPRLDGKHTNFGQVTAGIDIVKKIEGVKTGARDIPVEPVIIKSIELVK